MAIKNQTREMWMGEDVVIPFSSLTDSNGDAIDFTGAAISWKLTSKLGGGDTLVAKTESAGIAIAVGGASFEVTLDWSADFTNVNPKVYYHECLATLSGGTPIQVLAPSRFIIHASAT